MPVADFVGAVDQGTTSTRFMIFDHGGNEVGRHQLEHQQILPRPGWVEHNPVEIWERTRTVIAAALNAAGLAPRDLPALGIANQRETTVVWNRRTGVPYANAIVWQDTRTDRIAAAIKAEAPRVGALLRDVLARAPHALVLLVGYPDILPNTGHGCFPVVPFAHGDVPYLRTTEIELNQMLANEAAANGATFVDTYTPTIGHDACTSAGTRDVEGVIPTSPAYPFHPDKRGQQVMASRVLAALGVS